jgi:hypothetical protein
MMETLVEYAEALGLYLVENGVNARTESTHLFIEGPEQTTHVIQVMCFKGDAYFVVGDLVAKKMSEEIYFSDPKSFDLCLQVVNGP